jgi:ribonuclease J
VVGKVDCGYVFVDGSTVGDITESELKDRRILGEEGFISVIAVIDSNTGKVLNGPEITARGFAEDDAIFADLRPRLVDALSAAVADGVDDTHQLQQVIRRVTGRWVSGAHRRRPMIIPVVLEA